MNGTARVRRASACLLGLWLSTGAAAQMTFYVAECGDDSWSGMTDICQGPDGPKATIQAAVNAGGAGDTVLVLPGTYRQFATDLDRTIRSTDGPGVTTLTHIGLCCDMQYVIFVRNTARIEGFRIADFELGDWNHAAVTMDSADATFVDCVFQNCVTDGSGQPGRGGAVYAVGGAARFEGCEFIDCFAYGEWGGGSDRAYGGAIYAEDMEITLVGCRFVRNHSRDGGAVYFSDCVAQIADCYFEANSANANRYTWDGGNGGAIGGYGSISVRDSWFVDNSAGPGAAALRGVESVSGCVFLDNATDGNAPFGAPSIASAGSFDHCLFAGNVVDEGYDGPGRVVSGAVRGSLFYGNTGSGDCVVIDPRGPGVSNSVVYGNTVKPIVAGATVRYSDIEGGYPGEGNIDADPVFVDAPNGDYRLASGSPCIDAGDNTAVPLGFATDLNADPRFRDVPATGDTGVGIVRVVDMGAYEYQPGPFCAADFNDDGVVNTVDVLRMLNAWGAGEPTADLNADGQINTLDVLEYLGLWGAGC